MKVKAILRSSKEGQLKRWFPGWLHERYGDHYAQISTDTTLKLRSAVRDVCRERRGHIPPDLEELARDFLEPPQGITDYNFVMGYESDEGYVPGSSEPDHSGSDEALLKYIDRYPDDWEVVKKCLGLARQKSRHACGYIIANQPITSFIPLTTISDVRCTSFTAGAVEAVGGLKMDFLNIGVLKDIQDAIRLVQDRKLGARPNTQHINGRRVPSQRLVPDPKTNELHDIWDLPEDQAVFKDVAEGRTETVFQFNTPGAVQWLAHFNYEKSNGNKAIDSVEAMAAFTALDRPGPLDVKVWNPDVPEEERNDGNPLAQHNMLVEFARRARGAAGSPDILPILEKLVPETYGVMTYQEQLQRVYQDLTGCTGSEAEEFRTNVAKKKKEKVDKAYPGFMERAGAKVGREDAQKLWDFIKTWAQYGFNKSHAVCYAVIAYACAYLKHHYPLEWWCAVLRNATKEEVNKKFWRYVGNLVLLPDIRLANTNWEIEGNKIRAPMSLLAGIGDTAHAQLTKYAPYADLRDFVVKMKLHQEATKGPKQRKMRGTDQYETVPDAPGRNALHRGIVHTMVVAGVMDSVFPPDATVAGCMKLFEQMMTEVYGKKAKGKVYPALDPLGRYQARKAVLPAYGEDLRPILVNLGLPEYLRFYDGKRMRYVSRRWDRDIRQEVPTEDPVVGASRLEALNHTRDLPEGGYRCSVIAYVEETRPFKYGRPAKNKPALGLTLEVAGDKYEFVHWPNYDGELPDTLREVTPGCVVAALLVRNKRDKPFSVKELKVVRAALVAKEKKNAEGQGSSGGAGGDDEES